MLWPWMNLVQMSATSLALTSVLALKGNLRNQRRCCCRDQRQEGCRSCVSAQLSTRLTPWQTLSSQKVLPVVWL